MHRVAHSTVSTSFGQVPKRRRTAGRKLRVACDLLRSERSYCGASTQLSGLIARRKTTLLLARYTLLSVLLATA
jgi:hypothetical protein